MSDNRDLLEKVFTASIKHLLRKLDAGEITAAELAVASKILKDNGIQIPVGGDPNIDALVKHLPFQTPKEVEEERAQLQ